MSRLDEEDEGLFSGTIDRWRNAGERRFGSIVSDFVYYTIFAISPDVPRRVWLNFHQPDIGRTLMFASLITFSFTFVFTVIVTAISGTLFRDGDAVTVHFLEDGVNLALYLFVCPAYVALSCGILGLAAEHWSRQAPTDSSATEAAVSSVRGIVAIFLVLLVANIAISQYQFDLLTSQALEKRYWFTAMIGDVRVLNRAGFYYIILNFGLLCIAALGALAYASLAVKAVRDARSLDCANCSDLDTALSRFRDFKAAVVPGRLLVLCYMANVIIWSYSWLGDATLANVLTTTAAIIVIGVFGTRVPDTIVRRKIDALYDECALRGVDTASFDQPHKVPRLIRRLSASFKNLISLGFIVIMFPKLDTGDVIRDAIIDFAR